MGNPRGTFDLKSAYGIAMDKESDVATINADWIWELKTLSRIKTFLWMCSHGSIGVKECLVRRGVVEEDMCPTAKRSRNQLCML